ncbi:MAG: protease modulator HflC [Zoogloeaceae bacterium]|jgi:membrane protease subunit HflC|nr:protease modulator HflC [Zoogloeaceae bacterium]
MKVFLHIALTVLVALVALASSVFFTVDQRDYALLFQMGEVKLTITEPGLHFKWPIIQNVRVFDKRVLTIDSRDPELFITSEKKNVQVDSYVKWRIVDPELYYISVGDDESRASTRLMQTINAGLRAEFGKRTVRQVISDEREKIMEDMRVKANEDAKKIGVLVLDVRLKRVELPTNVADSVYERMRSERKQVANQLRAEGAKQYETTRAVANRKRVELLAQAYNTAQKIKGEGDAQAAAIYAKAFSRDPEFYAFYRSMEAYRETFKSKQDVLVVEPNSDFFRYLKNAR